MLVSCGRVGFDLQNANGDLQTDGGQTSGAGGTVNSDGGALGGGGDSGNSSSSGGVASTGGATGSGGTSADGATGSGGTSAGGAMGSGGVTTTGGAPASGGFTSNGGALASGGATGAGGSSGAGGAVATGGAGGCAPTNGGVEICDGRDNDCTGTIDDRGACPSICEGAAYGGHGYMLCGANQTNWDVARANCQATGMDLVVIGSAEENQFVFDWVNTRRKQVFIGGTDVATEGDWRWVDGTPFWNGVANGSAVGGAYTSWTPGQPDNAASASYEGDCAYMSWQDSGRWQDWWCQQSLDYMCETP